MAGPTLSILAIDDHPIAISGISEIVNRDFPNSNIESASTAADGLERVFNDQFNLILLDISLGTRNGLEILEEIRKHSPDTPVLIFSMFPEDPYGLRALRAGAAGYLRKDAPMGEVSQAIRTVLNGERYISKALSQELARYVSEDFDRPAHERLSRREFEVLTLIGKGMTVKQIGIHLNLSIKTISTYRARLLKELNLQTTADLIRYCIENNLGNE